MKVSIIVPVYNSELYLKSCLNSLTNQTLQDIEIICVDNCSTDSSMDILKKYAELDNRITIIRQTKNRGQCNSMIKGFKAATGEYVAECDADDIACPDMYEKLYAFAKTYGCDVVQCGFNDFTIESIQPRPVATKPIIFNLKDLSGIDLMQFIGNQPHIMSAVYRRDFLTSNRIWYRDGKDFEDTSLSFKLRTSATTYGMIPDCLYFYRRDNVNSGTFNIKKIDGLYEQFREVDSWNTKHSLGLDEVIGVWRYYTYKWASSYVSADDAMNFLQTISNEFKKGKVREDYFLSKQDFDDYKRILALPPGLV